MVQVHILDPRCRPEHLGFIPGFLDEDDPRPAAAQFGERYVGGWIPNGKGSLTNEHVLLYPGDPPLKPLAMIPLRDEKIFIYPDAFVAIVQPDGAFEWDRMD